MIPCLPQFKRNNPSCFGKEYDMTPECSDCIVLRSCFKAYRDRINLRIRHPDRIRNGGV